MASCFFYSLLNLLFTLLVYCLLVSDFMMRFIIGVFMLYLFAKDMDQIHKSELEKYSQQVMTLEARICDLEQELTTTELKSDSHEQSDGDSTTIVDEVDGLSMASSKTQVATTITVQQYVSY